MIKARPNSLIFVSKINLKKNMNIKPLGDRVVIKPIAEDITTKSGIVLPETVEKEKAEKGEVLAVGPGRVLDNGAPASMSVKVGDKVMFKKYSPDEIKVDGEELLIISEQDILAIVNGGGISASRGWSSYEELHKTSLDDIKLPDSKN